MEWVGDLERAFATAIYPNRVVIAIGGLLVLVALAIAARRGHWADLARRRPRTTAVVALVALAVVLPTGWYLGSPLFLSTRVDEPAPIVAVAASQTPPGSVVPATPAATPPASTLPPSSPTAPASSPTALPSGPTPAPTLTERTGKFHGMDDFHFGRGTARLIETAPGAFTIRLEDFAVRNGPDLFVFLSPSAKGYAAGAVQVARLKADTGNQNYPLKAGIDVHAAKSVVIWCKQFGVLFATAPLS